MKKFITSTIALLGLAASLQAVLPDIPRTSIRNNITEDTTWTKDRIWVLEDYIFVTNDATLTIEPGTYVAGGGGTGDQAKALVITRGAKIIADGTPEEPIVFTSEFDDGSLDFNSDRGLWGGLIVLGKAWLNSNRVAGSGAEGPGTTSVIEGIPTRFPLDDITYGGEVDNDNSGIIRYCSIMYTGAQLGAGDEIQGLTLGGVGSGTTIEFVEIIATDDDGIEWFGGSADVKYAFVGWASDDHYDLDEGARVRLQFVAALAYPDSQGESGRLFEIDGGNVSAPEGEPYTQPVVYNATLVGIGADYDRSTLTNDFNTGMEIRENSRPRFFSSIITEMNEGGLDINENASTHPNVNSKIGFLEGDIQFMNNVWGNAGNLVRAGITLPIAANDLPEAALLMAENRDFAASIWDVNVLEQLQDEGHTPMVANNVIADPELRNIVWSKDDGLLDLRPVPGGFAATFPVATPPNDGFFDQVNFIGAFDPSVDGTWLDGWSQLYKLGYLPQQQGPIEEPVIAFFGDDLYNFGGNAFEDQWYFSFTFKSIYHFTGDNWFFFEELNAFVWVNTDMGSVDTAFWAYADFLSEGHTAWIYLGHDTGFHDLRDSNGDGTNDLPDSAAGDQPLNGFYYMLQPFFGDPSGANWYYFSELEDGNWTISTAFENPESGDWIKLR